MITVTNFKDVLKLMGFVSHDTIFTNEVFSLSVDFANQKLVYPNEIRGREHNTSFTAPENFVVFECVCRLLMKGYRPEDIELEKAWPLGRTQKSGRADICIYEKGTDKVLMIIECKTWGREFDSALNDTRTDGAQLFSYWQQEISAKWLVLYTSDIKDGNIIYKSPAVNCSDDPNLRLGQDDSLKLYANVHSAVEKFAVWHETYNLEMHDDVIFSAYSQPYNIGVRPLFKRDLIAFEGQSGIVNKFEEILRHNNVSDKENAFNRLIALFICKLVDELTKEEDAEVAFQYKPGADSYETLQDRLQQLYTQGMKDFMREDITYIPANYPEQIFSNYKGRNRQKAIEELNEAFRQLKYFTNNDFAFKDVHNEKLFYENGKVLVEVVQLFQRYRIVHTSRHQLLGDLFEQLLDKGFKQNEGQFFTPMPITRFIWDCLPMRRYKTCPKVIDYACGAGHFLTEAVEAINHFILSDNNHWTQNSIFGIEKDYRLARVSKVAMFMNGAGESNIIFGDGLENSDLIRSGTFDILTANPPYSVAAFKQHLSLKKNTLALLEKIGNAGSEIEVLFVERIGQLLASGGIAAVILPSSVLSNGTESYTGARKEILSKFMVRAIVKLGNKAFQKTGTNTVIMFLERYSYPPERSSLVIDSVDAILNGSDLAEWEDSDILMGYLGLQGLSVEEWNMCVKRSPEFDTLPEYFRNYYDVFSSRKGIKQLKPEEYRRKFWEYVREIEREKLFYYGMTYRQRTVVIVSPSDVSEQREFLGYGWSEKKGDEGIQYIGVRGGKMYVNADREAEGTLAHVVRQSFEGGVVEISEENAKYVREVRTSDMLDFSRVGFDAAVRLIEHKGFIFATKYPMRKLSSLATMLRGGKSPVYGTSSVQVIKSGQARGFHDFDFTNHYYLAENVELDERKLQKGDLLINSLGVGTAGRVTAFDLDGDYVTDSTITIFRPNDEVLSEYVLLALGCGIGFKALEKMAVGATGQVSLKMDTICNLTIPLPPMDVQQQIVSECSAVDAHAASLTSRITSCREQIEALFRQLESLPTTARLAFDDKRAFTLAIGKRVLNSELVSGGKIPVFSANVFEPFGYVNELLKGFEDFSSDFVLWGIDGDFMVNFLARDTPFYPTDHCGVLRVLSDKIHPRYAARVLEREGKGLGFSRSYRASLDRVGRITFSVPEIDAQNRAMNKVLKLEAEIKNAQTELKTLTKKKTLILKKYL